MNFEELESAWTAQPSAPVRAVDTAELKRAILPELKRRGRFFGYGIFVSVFFLVVYPLLTVANYRFAPPRDAVWHWLYFAAWMLLASGVLVFLIRRVQSHGSQLQRGTRSVKEFVAASLASLETEMRDCRAMFWTIPALVAFQLTNLYVRFPVAELGWRPFGLRAAGVAGFTALVSAIFWRHYQKNLKPDHARQTKLLRELS